MEIIYIFQTGAYDRLENKMVTTDVKKVAKAYAEITNKKNYSSSHDEPNVEIWKDGKRIDSFFEFEKSESKIKKALTKKAIEIE